MRWEWYANRKDLMQMIKVAFDTKQVEEYFVNGRPDCLKCRRFSSRANFF